MFYAASLQTQNQPKTLAELETELNETVSLLNSDLNMSHEFRESLRIRNLELKEIIANRQNSAIARRDAYLATQPEFKLT